MKTLYGFFIAVLLALALGVVAPTPAYAQAADAQTATFIGEILGMEYNEKDLAHVSIKRLFGGFVFKPFGNAPADPATPLAKVLGYTNVVAMILGCVIMSYVILGGAVNTAASGELLGRSWSSVWLPMRTTVAFGMIMPATDGEQVFSVAQTLVIWMVIVGSNSGTWLWDKGSVALMGNAGVMPVTSFYDATQYQSVVSVFNCAMTRKNMLSAVGDTTELAKGQGYALIPSTSTGLDSVQPISMTASGLNLPGEIYRSLVFYDCGEISMPNMSLSFTPEGKSSAASGGWEGALIQNFQSRLPGELNKFLNMAASVIYEINSADFTGKTVQAMMSENFDDRGPEGAAIAAELENLAQLYASIEGEYAGYNRSMAESLANNEQAQAYWKAQIQTGGWVRAGAWFFEATRYQGLSQTLMSEISKISSSNTRNGLGFVCGNTQVNEGTGWFMTGVKKVAGSFDNCNEKIELIEQERQVLKLVEREAQMYKERTGHSSSTSTTVSQGINAVDSEKGISPDIANIFSTSLTKMTLNVLGSIGCSNAAGGGSSPDCTDMTSDLSGMTSPFTMLSAIGHGMVGISTTMWGIGLVGVVAASSADGASFGVLKGLSAGTNYVVGSVMAAISGVLAMGFMFAYVLPFMPVMAWIMIVIGYLITVVEAVAAAPLAVIMMATPEGEGLSGANMQRAIQLVNAIILKPTLCVVGLFAAMTISYVGFALVNNLFWTVANLQNGMAIFGFIATMSLYTALCYRVVQAMIGIMAMIPNQILEWMAGGVSREFGSSISEDVSRMPGVSQGAGEASAARGFAAARDAMNNKTPKDEGAPGPAKPKK